MIQQGPIHVTEIKLLLHPNITVFTTTFIMAVLLDYTNQISGIISVQPTKINITHQPALYTWLLHVSTQVTIVARYFLTSKFISNLFILSR